MLKTEKLSVTLGGKDIIKDVSLSVKPHTLNCIIGKNGSGKTTFLSALNCGVKYRGQVSFCDKNLALTPSKERAKLISLLPQHLPTAAITCRELVEMGRTPYLDIGKRFTLQDIKAVNEAIETAGIAYLQNKRVDCISGGERQKVYLAMVMAQQSRIITLDEPATYLDTEHRNEIYNLLIKLKTEKKKTVLAVTHDITAAMEIADNIIFFDKGKLIFFGSAEDCIDSGLIEKVFKVKKYYYESEEGKRILYK